MDAFKKFNISIHGGSSLNEDLLIEILRRLPFKSLARFKCVSKAWHGLVSDLYLQASVPAPTIGLFYQPWNINLGEVGYVSVSKEICRAQLITDLSLKFLPAYPNLRFMDCCNGLLLFLHGSACPPYGRARRRGLPPHSNVFFVCNPITKRWVALPECPETKPWFDCILVFDPRNSPHFKAIRIAFLNPTCLELTTFCSKTGFWIKSNVITAPLRCRLSSRGIVSPDGIVYRLGPFRRLQRINVVDGSVMETVLPEKWKWPPCFGLFHGNVRYALFLGGCQLRIWELKDLDANEWVLKHNNCLEAELQQKFGWFRRIRLLAFHSEFEVVYIGICNKIISYNFSNETMEEICSFPEQYHLVGELKAHPFVPCFLDCLDEMQNNQ